MGLASAWALTKAGARVTLFERDRIAGPLSASGDHTRIIRRAYAGLDGYARLMDEAFAAWDEMWSDLGARHLHPRGALIVSQGAGDSAETYRDGLERTGQPFETLKPGPAAARFPFLDPDRIAWAVHSPDAGILMCRRIAADLARWLRARGCEICEGAAALAVEEDGTVRAEGVRRFDAVLVAAGAWAPALFADLAQRLTTYRTAVAYLRPPDAEAWRDAPVLLDVGGEVDGYGIPPVEGLGLKLGYGGHKRPRAAHEDRSPWPGEGETIRAAFPVLARLEDYAVEAVSSCAYAFTEDHRFHAEARGRVWIVSACSGHGYKFGAAAGRRIARAVLDGDAPGLAAWLRAEAPRPA